MSRSRISLVDHAWLRMDSPYNWMVINGLMTFDTPVSVEALKETVQGTLLRFDRFRQRLVWPRFQIGRPFWMEDPDFDLDYHIVKVTLPPPADQSALQDLISEMMRHPLDYTRPLWRYYLVEEYGKGSALVARMHHCLADGIALMQVLLRMASTTPDSLPTGYELQELPGQSAEPSGLEETLEIVPSSIKVAAKAARNLAREGRKVLTDPLHARDLAELGTKTAVAVGRLALRWPDPQTLFKTQLGIEKRAVWSAPIPLKEVKRVSHAFGATINDILLTAVAGSIRHYLEYRSEPVDGLSIRGIVPVNLRTEAPVDELGNKFGLVFLSLPVGIADPIQRLRALKCCMDDIKSTPEALASYGILGTLGAVHPLIQDVAVSIFDTKGSAVMTNVPGPRQQLYLAGAPLNTVMAWVPQSGRVGLGVSVISYNGKIWLGMATDKSQVPDPERFLTGFEAEFEVMKQRAEQVLARRKAPIQSMISMLDEALSALDEVLAAQAPEAQAAPQAQAAREQHKAPKQQAAPKQRAKPKKPIAQKKPAAIAKPASQIQPPPPVPACCQGRTRSGQPCKNPPLPGKAFCRIHQKQAEVALET